MLWCRQHKSSRLARVKAIARKMAKGRGVQPEDRVGPEFLVAGLLKVVGAKAAARLLGKAGLPAVDIAAIPDASPEEVERLPSLAPDAHLAKLMRGPLSSYLKGEMLAEAALAVLLAPENLTPGVRVFLNSPRQYPARANTSQEESTRDLLRSLAAYWQPRYRLGHQYYSINAECKSDFVTGRRDEAFFRAVEDAYVAEEKTHDGLFGGHLYATSPIGKCRDRLGKLEADILSVVLVAELGQLPARGALTMNEITWCIAPKCYYRALGSVFTTVKRLRSESLVEVVPEYEHLRLHCHVIPAGHVLEEFLEFLRDADPITDQEAQDMLKRLARSSPAGSVPVR